MPREANAVDFWRGFALVSIFINHIPGICYERLTHRNLSISDSAELFVFLAGWSLGLLVGEQQAPPSTARAGARLGGRAVTIYAAQILISSACLAMLASTAYFTRQPAGSGVAQRGGRVPGPGAHAHRPRAAHASARLLRHPAALCRADAGGAGCSRSSTASPGRCCVPLSLALYFASLIVPFTAPTWPVPGQWFFNPFTWQAIFVLGFALVARRGAGRVCAAQHDVASAMSPCRSWPSPR